MDGDVFNGAEAHTEVPLQARYGESTGVIERGMNEERRTGTWEALLTPPGNLPVVGHVNEQEECPMVRRESDRPIVL